MKMYKHKKNGNLQFQLKSLYDVFLVLERKNPEPVATQ